jgi:hypothetical protein
MYAEPEIGMVDEQRQTPAYSFLNGAPSGGQ